MAYSGTYNFSSLESADIIIDAYERIGIPYSKITQEQILTAQRTINFILTAIVNKGLNLFTVQQFMIPLVPNQYAYDMPPNTIQVLEATVRETVRNLGGTAFSSAGGVASNAFSGNPALACTQTAPNGYISYDWGVGQYAISVVGVQSNATLTYTLVFEYSNDNVNWTEVGAPVAQTYTQGVNVWFVIQAPVTGGLFRVRETNGATLNIQELYFDSQPYDLIITALSRGEWVALPYKTQTGRPTSFYLDKQINPILNLWPVPTPAFNNLYITATQHLQDIGQLMNAAQVPVRFFEALTALTAYKLALKYDKSQAPMLKQDAAEEMDYAKKADIEKVPLRIYGTYQQGWAQL